jgi:hypothetical protein
MAATGHQVQSISPFASRPGPVALVMPVLPPMTAAKDMIASPVRPVERSAI